MSEHRAAGIVFRDHVGRVLLQFRDDWATSDPLSLALFGGGVEAGETDLQAALRETKEELGLTLSESDVRPLCVLSWKSMSTGQMVVVTMFEAVKPLAWGEFVVNEGEGAAFLTKDQVESLPFVSHLAKTVVREHC